jgi:hypothetical protein
VWWIDLPGFTQGGAEGHLDNTPVLHHIEIVVLLLLAWC